MTVNTAVTHLCAHAARPAAKSVARRGRKYSDLLAGLGFVAVLSLAQSNAALAATAPPLGSTSNFGIVSNTFTNTANPTVITGSVCYTTAPVTPPTTITGGPAKTPCSTEIADQAVALANLDSQLGTCVPLGAAVDLSAAVVSGGTPGVIPPGCYSSTGAMSIGSTLLLNGGGVYVFRPGAGATTAALNTAANSIVTLNGACASDVFWAPTAATTLGANSTFVGTIIDAAGITMGQNATVAGRALAAGGTVTTDANAITVPGACTPAVLPTITVTKVSNGGVGSFSFTGNNGFAAQSITTLTAGTGVAGATQTLTAAGVSTTITEAAPPAGYTLASISCSGLGAGGTQTPDLATRTVTLNPAATAAGSAIACTFTNRLLPVASIPTLSEWAMIMLAGLMAIAGFAAIRRKGM